MRITLTILLFFIVLSYACHPAKKPDAQTIDPTPKHEQVSEPAHGTTLLGTWDDGMETFQFKENGEGVYYDQTFKYHFDSDHLWIETIFDTTEVSYILYGDSLKLIREGVSSTFRRK